MTAYRSTTRKGDAFRDFIATLLGAAGFTATPETRELFKKADVRAQWLRNDLDGPARYLIEAKDYEGTLPLEECSAFVSQYGTLVDAGTADKAWLISRGQISPDGRAQIEARRGLKCFTLAEFQRALLQLDGYLLDLIASYEGRQIERYYIAPHTDDEVDLGSLADAWLKEDHPEPLAIISGYGKGKSTFALHHAARMAREALEDKTKRVPILISLGDVMDTVGVDSLVGKVLTSTHRAANYHWHLFEELNRAGRFLVILDGLDEMKHGMTLGMFERSFDELMKFDQGDARVLVLGRGTAFHNDEEFQSVIAGRRTTVLGTAVRAPNRRECRAVSLREFSLMEVGRYVRSYFPLRVEQLRSGGSIDSDWVAARTDELLNDQFAALIRRPVHAQMLCEVATDPELSLVSMTKLRLYDTFVHYLLEREVRKEGRDPAIPIQVRVSFNAAVAWWLWSLGSATTASLDSIPVSMVQDAIGEMDTEYDLMGLQRELAAGLLVEKSQAAVYFPHRSIQEFLVALHIIRNGLRAVANNGDPTEALRLLNPEIVDFITAYVQENDTFKPTAREWVTSINSLRHKVYAASLLLLVKLARILNMDWKDFRETPWMYLLGYYATIDEKDNLGDPEYAAQTAAYIVQGWEELDAEGPLILIGQTMAQSAAAFATYTPKVFAAWLPARELADAVARASKGRNAIAQVHREEQPRLWYFLELIEVAQSDNLVTVALNVSALRDLYGEFPIGFADAFLRPDHPNAQVTCSVQSLYRALAAQGVSERVLEGIRPFFNDRQLRSRVRPLVVERRSRPAQTYIGRDLSRLGLTTSTEQR